MTELPGVTLLVHGDETQLRIGDSTLHIPTSSVHLNGGKLLLEVQGDLAATLPADHVAVMAMHPEPSDSDVAMVVDQLDPLVVTALMGHESSIGALDDPIGLVAMRAVCRAVRGESMQPPDPLATL